MTRKQMSDEVQYWLGLQDIAGFDERQFIYDKLYQGTVDMLARTKCVARCLDLNVRAGEEQYILDHSVLALVDIENGARRKVARDARHDDFPGVVVYPAGTTPWQCDTTFTLIRSDVLLLQPAPQEDGVVQCWAVLRPNQMANDSDSPGDEKYGAIPEEYQDAITLYALWKCADYADDQSAQQGERYRMLYEGQDGKGGRLSQIRSSVNRRGTARAPGRRVRLRGVSSNQAWVG